MITEVWHRLDQGCSTSWARGPNEEEKHVFSGHIINNIFFNLCTYSYIITVIQLRKSWVKWTEHKYRTLFVFHLTLGLHLFIRCSLLFKEKRSSLRKMTLLVGHTNVDTGMYMRSWNANTAVWSFIVGSISVRCWAVSISENNRSQIWVLPKMAGNLSGVVTERCERETK